MNSLPSGDPVSTIPITASLKGLSFEGTWLSLKPINPEQDSESLFAASHGSELTPDLWTYMAYGPFVDSHAMQSWMQGLVGQDDPLFLTVHHHELGPIGMVSFLNIVPQMKRLEIGNIWYGPSIWGSKANTEAALLMMEAAFEKFGYRRVEWKCDALNQRSRNAALRLGFSFEGIFRQHMIVKGRNRDTAWFAIIDSQWPAISSSLRKWLYANPQNLPLRAFR